MLFNSLEFFVFFFIAFISYWSFFKSKTKLQNLLILLLSYFFYGWWDWRFLALIILSTLIDYIVGYYIGKKNNDEIRKKILLVSLFSNLGILFFFKYFNFFIESWIELCLKLGLNTNLNSIKIILPVGISFYTFQTLSYTIDIYRKNIKPAKSLLDFAAFVAFFPQLVAGPIERASHLLPQFYIKRTFKYDYALTGVNLFIWGLFKKVVIADTCANYVNCIFANYESLNSLSLILGVFYFAFQIYADFSGYSDMAIGLSRLLGFDLMKNFNYPYFSRNIAEFWRRWHISLSTWFRDYLYIPLGGALGKVRIQIRNVFIIFLVSGFWHGANWTFVFWGLLNAIYFLPLLLRKKNRSYLDDVDLGFNWNSLTILLRMLFTFLLVCFAWIFFRAKTISESFSYIEKMATNFNFKIEYLSIDRYNFELLLLIVFFVMIEWVNRKKEEPLSGKGYWLKLSLILILIISLGSYSNINDFIYFQF